MADLPIIAANVQASASAKKRIIKAGATVTAGQGLYEDSTASFKGKLAQANSADTDHLAGVALNGGDDEQPVEIVYEDDDFTPGATLSPGQVYVLSAATAGAFAPVSDLLATNQVTVVMVAKSTTKAMLKIINSGTAKA